MSKKVLLFCAFLALAVCANASSEADVERENTVENEIFTNDAEEPAGFITELINNSLASSLAPSAADKQLGRTLTDYASVPKIGGYFVEKFAYTDKEGQKNGNNGFSQRLIRFYVDGTILGDFAYRFQMQTNNDKFHMKDFFLEWRKYPEFKVKIGQFKRAFGLENPMNPWDVGVGDYSQLTKKLTGHTDYIGAENASNGGRDQGIQVQGDLFPVKDGHRLLHYQMMVSNGQGINTGDANSQKDVSGTLQLQPMKGIMIGVFGWTGNFTANGITVNRNRYEIVGRYERNDWSFRAEYAHSTGHKISDYNGGNWTGNARSDAWYATLGIPCNSWLKTWLKYDVYRDDASWSSTKSIYSVCPNICLHRNLMFQPQFNYVHDRSFAGKSDYCELWVETYVRF